MRVDAKILGGLFVASVLSLFVFYGVNLRMAMSEIISLLAFFLFQVIHVREGMPPPVAHGVEGNAVFIVLNKCLHSCHVDGCGKMTITYGE